MAIVPMKKVLICGLKKDRKGTLELLQRQGALEISNVLEEDNTFRKMDVTSSKTVFERNAVIAEQALAVLEQYAPEKKSILSSFAGRELLTVDEYRIMQNRLGNAWPRYQSWSSSWRHWLPGAPLICRLTLREPKRQRRLSVPYRRNYLWNR